MFTHEQAFSHEHGFTPALAQAGTMHSLLHWRRLALLAHG
jgi:hypothetical protein